MKLAILNLTTPVSNPYHQRKAEEALFGIGMPNSWEELVHIPYSIGEKEGPWGFAKKVASWDVDVIMIDDSFPFMEYLQEWFEKMRLTVINVETTPTGEFSRLRVISSHQRQGATPIYHRS
jgi:hypothetical protein